MINEERSGNSSLTDVRGYRPEKDDTKRETRSTYLIQAHNETARMVNDLRIIINKLLTEIKPDRPVKPNDETDLIEKTNKEIFPNGHIESELPIGQLLLVMPHKLQEMCGTISGIKDLIAEIREVLI